MNISKKRLAKNEKGAAAVEFAIVLPILVAIVGGIFQFGFIFNYWISLTHAASEGARLAAVGQTDAYVQQKVIDSTPSPIPDVNISFEDINGDGIRDIGEFITVTVTGEAPNIGIIFPASKTFTLTGTATMRKEQ